MKKYSESKRTKHKGRKEDRPYKIIFVKKIN